MFRAVLYMFVRYLMESDSRCLRCLMFMPSGPVELLLVLFEMANCICKVASHISSIGRFLDCMVYVPVDFVCTIWSDVCELFIKCFLSISVMAILVLKQMLLFCCVGCFLLDSFAMVPYRECGLCL